MIEDVPGSSRNIIVQVDGNGMDGDQVNPME